MSDRSLTRQEIETWNANVRAKATMRRGSRLVLMSRTVVGVFLLAVCLLLWVAQLAGLSH